MHTTPSRFRHVLKIAAGLFPFVAIACTA